jgi:hypothetical protein
MSTDPIRAELDAYRAETQANRAETAAFRAELRAYRDEVISWRQSTEQRFDVLDRELQVVTEAVFDIQRRLNNGDQ